MPENTSPVIDYPLPSRWLRPLFLAAERHEAVYRLTVPVWVIRYRWLKLRGICA